MSISSSYPTRRVTLLWPLRDTKRSSPVRHATRTSNATDARKTTTQFRRTTFYKATKISLVYSLQCLPDGLVCWISRPSLELPILSLEQLEDNPLEYSMYGHTDGRISAKSILPHRAEFPELTDIDFLFFPATVLSLLMRKERRQSTFKFLTDTSDLYDCTFLMYTLSLTFVGFHTKS